MPPGRARKITVTSVGPFGRPKNDRGPECITTAIRAAVRKMSRVRTGVLKFAQFAGRIVKSSDEQIARPLVRPASSECQSELPRSKTT